MTDRKRNSRGRFLPSAPIDVREESQVPELEEMIHAGPITFVLIYADWCGHCVRYKPTWKELENTPGRTANIAMVHHDMQENSPSIKKAKIQGYPSVIKIYPSGKIEEYKIPGSEETTNALPEMRNVPKMKEELSAPSNSRTPGTQAGIVENADVAKKSEILESQTGGAFQSVLGAFTKAIRGTGTEMRRMFGRRSFRAPKRHSRRGSTRKLARSTRKRAHK